MEGRRAEVEVDEEGRGAQLGGEVSGLRQVESESRLICDVM